MTAEFREVGAAQRALSRIRSQQQLASPAASQVIKYILANPEQVIGMTVTELASAADVSAATVTRCCRDLGFVGYQDMKLSLARDAAPLLKQVHAEILPGDSPAQVLAKVSGSSAEALLEVHSSVDPEAFSGSVAAIVGADIVLLVGVGASAPLAQDAAHRLGTIGYSTIAPPDAISQNIQASRLGPDAVCIAISHTGSSMPTVRSASLASEQGASVIAVTSFVRSPLSEVADYALVVGGREAFRLEALASRMAHLAILDSLYVAAALASPERTSQALDTSGEVVGNYRF
jgi:DNA-binding MurR/RpiR family transcriptional regulator